MGYDNVWNSAENHSGRPFANFPGCFLQRKCFCGATANTKSWNLLLMVLRYQKKSYRGATLSYMGVSVQCHVDERRRTRFILSRTVLTDSEISGGTTTLFSAGVS